jgi:hypothetical protein
MDVIFDLLKELSTGIGPTQYLIIVLLIVVASFYLARYLARNSRKKGGSGFVRFFLGNGESDDASADIVKEVRAKLESIHEEIEEHATKIAELCEANNRELVEIRQDLKLHQLGDAQAFEVLRENFTRISEALTRLTSQIDKIDEFTRAAIPEFRAYHKDISNDLSDLSRDVALVERSIQVQLNSINAVKLR